MNTRQGTRTARTASMARPARARRTRFQTATVRSSATAAASANSAPSLFVSAAELVERPRLHPPDRPAVELEQRPATDRHECIPEQDDECGERGDAEQTPLPFLAHGCARAAQERRYAKHQR